MKVIRYLDAHGSSAYAWLDAEGKPRRLRGHFGAWEKLDEPVFVAQTLAPVEPPAIYGIGLNYRVHAQEAGQQPPEFPMVFLKAPTAVQAPGAPIVLPRHLRSNEVDFEAELAVVIGKTCKNVHRSEALSYIAGYTCANDVSARDWQFRWGGGQFSRSKTFDTFCPLGPWMVTADDIPDPQRLRVRSIVNGHVMQDSSTADMIFDVATLVAFLSGSTTLRPGTVILTGTPPGIGYARIPPVFLSPGDVVEVDVEHIGRLKNSVIAETE